VGEGNQVRRHQTRLSSWAGRAVYYQQIRLLRRKRRDPPASRLGRQSYRPIRFRLKSPTRCATMILLAHSDSRGYPRAAVWVPHRLPACPIAIWRGRHIQRRRTVVTRGCNRSPNDRSGSETAYQSGRNISAARLDWNGGSTRQSQHNCRWQEQKPFHLVTRGPSIPGHHHSSNF
jgi:hypothetical protein